MGAIILIVVLASAVWVGADASKRDWSQDKFARSTTAWVLGTLLLWIIVFPVYLAKRDRAPLKRGAGVPATVPATLPASPLSATASPPPPPPPPMAPAADWYPDPQGVGRVRYWDGARWTEHTAD